MTVTELTALGRLLAGHLELFAECLSSRPILEHFGGTVAACCRTCRGSRSSRLRCSGGTPVRTLQRFLRTSMWDPERMRDLCQQRLAASPQLAKPAKLSALSEPIKSDDLGTIGLIDETSVAKKGDETPGVQRH